MKYSAMDLSGHQYWQCDACMHMFFKVCNICIVYIIILVQGEVGVKVHGVGSENISNVNQIHRIHS